MHVCYVCVQCHAQSRLTPDSPCACPSTPNLTVQVNWDYMEKDLLTKFWASSPQRMAMRRGLPDCMAVRLYISSVLHILVLDLCQKQQ